MKVLNLYAGLGGNRKLWEGVEVTAVEYREDIAKFYSDHYPQDAVIVGDATEYLLDHYRDFDIVWASPPCPSHSFARFWASRGGKYRPEYPDMSLYQVILFLQHYFDGQWAVENVKPFYTPMIPPSIQLGRHLFWSNFKIDRYDAIDADIQGGKRDEWQEIHGIDISGYSFSDRTDKLLRNCVHYGLGKHILDCAIKSVYEGEQQELAL